MKKFLINTLIYVILIVAAVAIIYPLLWVLITSFKSNKEYYTNIFGLPKVYVWANYAKAWSMGKINISVINSLIVVPLSMLALLFMTSTSSYVLARFEFRGRNLIKALFISMLTVPALLFLIPQFILVKNIGLHDTRLILIILYAVSAVPFNQLLMLGFLKTVPKELEESAFMDGASYSRTFFSIILPVMQPVLMTMIIISFMTIFNDYFTALIYISTPEKFTIPVGLANLAVNSRYRVEWGAMMAGNVIMLVPTFLFYLIFQSKIQKGITMGSLKA